MLGRATPHRTSVGHTILTVAAAAAAASTAGINKTLFTTVARTHACFNGSGTETARAHQPLELLTGETIKMMYAQCATMARRAVAWRGNAGPKCGAHVV